LRAHVGHQQGILAGNAKGEIEGQGRLSNPTSQVCHGVAVEFLSERFRKTLPRSLSHGFQDLIEAASHRLSPKEVTLRFRHSRAVAPRSAGATKIRQSEYFLAGLLKTAGFALDGRFSHA